MSFDPPDTPSANDPQRDLFGAPAKAAPALPDGFGYWPEVLSPPEEAALVARLRDLAFQPYEFRGYLGNRRVVWFGRRYDHARQRVDAAEPIPDFLLEARARVATAAGLAPEDFVQALASEYAPGAGIGWHRDRPAFGQVMGLSLLTPCRLRLRRRSGPGWERAAIPLPPRSAYLLSGPARWVWEHSIVPMAELRYSITFRTLADRS